MCGVVGIVAKCAVNQDLYDSLIALQHRGQDAAGIATSQGHRVFLHRGPGLVRDVFRTRHMHRLVGNMGIGHVRYPTAGGYTLEEAQPFYVNSPYGLLLAHNGNLTNTSQLRDELWQTDRRHVNTNSDTEVLLNIFATALQQQQTRSIGPTDIFKAVAEVHRRCRGAYSVVAMITGYGIVAFRDPHGIRPLVYGVRHSDAGDEYVVASESVVLDALGFKRIADVAPGGAVYITEQGKIHTASCFDNAELHPCIFEYVYLSRPDSILDNILVYKVRLKLGEYLAQKIQQQYPDWKFDVVMPIPATSNPVALRLAACLGVKYREGFVKNRYIGRTFIMPNQKLRSRSVRQKLNPIPLEFQGKNVLLVDDSIVRGTTSREIVAMAREAGANKVYFASAAPMIPYPNVYGIDMPAAKDLVAHGRSEAEICQHISADGLVFQAFTDLVAAVREGNPDITRFEDAIFTGNYLTGDIDAAYLTALENARG